MSTMSGFLAPSLLAYSISMSIFAQFVVMSWFLIPWFLIPTSNQKQNSAAIHCIHNGQVLTIGPLSAVDFETATIVGIFSSDFLSRMPLTLVSF